MAAQNEFQARLDALNEQLAAAQQEVSENQRQASAQQTRLADWMRNYRGPGHSTEADAAIADATRWITTFSNQARDAQARVDAIKKSIEKTEAELSEYNAALADAASQGLVGAAAEIAAQAKVEQAKGIKNLLTYTGIGLLVVLLIVGVIWYRRRKR